MTSSSPDVVREMEVKRESGCPEQDGVRCTCTKALVRLNKLREKNLLCDAVLRSEDGGVFRVHRVILSMRSEYFRTLFTTTLHTSEETDILLHGVSSDMITLILDYVYFREVDIRSDNARQLLETAEYLWVPGFTELCCDFLKEAMDVLNCINILRVARAKTKTDPLVPVEDEPLLLLVQDNTASKSSDILRITPEPPVHAMDRMTDKFTLLVQGLSRTALTSEFAVGWCVRLFYIIR
ncbi:Kelch-like protein 21 [Zootermopsis nevadensis]|uniref:Kelch-like protein 21 n=1 Tax=Zootermopsis nevadensis TaxID=136037 RepID=A0A067QL83_ZOONE|nr:Kelch-like protein 21 [Zootermopsis nevadensis]